MFTTVSFDSKKSKAPFFNSLMCHNICVTGCVCIFIRLKFVEWDWVYIRNQVLKFGYSSTSRYKRYCKDIWLNHLNVCITPNITI